LDSEDNGEIILRYQKEIKANLEFYTQGKKCHFKNDTRNATFDILVKQKLQEVEIDKNNVK
jgi:hypothetical protein